MTRINIISGFLGAGKTTLIKKLLSGGAFEGEKLVLLENEYGEVGVDGAFMKNSGIEITELNSGCICCTLAGDFHDALIELIDKYHPDRVIIEPSGVGKLSEVRNVIAGLANEIDISLEACATVADVNRCRVYARNFGEFFTDQIASAECVVLSRTQISTPDKIEKAIELLRSINEGARIVTTPWDELPAEKLLS
ncbi:MAG: GTP-binding protein, partial [Clostridia bacterium]|nr:GTP-binding protein [Clostridia bacterium]